MWSVPSISRGILELGPVRALPIYKEPRNLASKAMFNSPDLNLWQNCKSILLTKNYRQGESAWNQMLNRIRIGEQTEEDIKILESRPSTLLSPEEYDRAIHLFFTNLEVNTHNENILNSLKEELKEIEAHIKDAIGKSNFYFQFAPLDSDLLNFR